jgi:hypothetical protein
MAQNPIKQSQSSHEACCGLSGCKKGFQSNNSSFHPLLYSVAKEMHRALYRKSTVSAMTCLFLSPQRAVKSGCARSAALHSLGWQASAGDLKTGQKIAGLRILWDRNTVATTVDQALAAARTEVRGETRGEQTAKNEAVEFLRKLLAHGPMPAMEIQQQAVDAGLLGSTTTIGDSKPFRAARQILGITSTKAGMQAGWSWALPNTTREPEDALPNARAPSDVEGAFAPAAVERVDSGSNGIVGGPEEPLQTIKDTLGDWEHSTAIGTAVSRGESL